MCAHVVIAADSRSAPGIAPGARPECTCPLRPVPPPAARKALTP